VSRLELRPFADEHLDAAAELLAERHRCHRVGEAALPARFEDPAAAREEVEKAWRLEGASGAAGLVDGRLAGYLLGAPDDEAHWGGPNVWVGYAGHAAAEAETVRDLYGLAARRWVDEGRPRHYVQVPASEPEVIEAWYRVGFGQQHAAAVTEVPDVPWPEGVREARPDDLEGVFELTPLIREHQSSAPVFSANLRVESPEQTRAAIVEEITNEEVGALVAEAGDRLAGGFIVAAAEQSGDGPHAFTGLARPERAAYLAWAVTRPEVRGSGAGVALTEASFAWARRGGYETMVTDWRVTNLLASRFWPRRGFRTAFLRLYRSIP
jgi:ribosomal protein S18 acetylase RimI-like enzyme